MTRAVLSRCELSGICLSGNGGGMRENLKLVPVDFRLPVLSVVQSN